MKKIIVGLSGGVDSSVAALLLQQQGYAVEGLFMKNWEGDDENGACPADRDVVDAKAVCDQLQIPLHTVNFSREYWDRVFRYFLDEYHAGRTPNPDVLCNKEIKFRAFLDYALALGAFKIATGHYARITQDTQGYHLLKGLDPEKDQTYFLHQLNQHQLMHTVFPLGRLHKKEVRHIAETAGFINAKKKDSTGICFIGEKQFKKFLQEFLPAKPGLIQSIEGETLGQHEGLMYYTIGQRKGLQIGGVKGRAESAWYVVKKDLVNNILVVVQQYDHPALLKSQLILQDIHWISGKAPTFPFDCQAHIRYHQPNQACRIEKLSDHYELTFTTPQRAPTPGQYVVLYQEEDCLGGAVIQWA